MGNESESAEKKCAMLHQRVRNPRITHAPIKQKQLRMPYILQQVKLKYT